MRSRRLMAALLAGILLVSGAAVAIGAGSAADPLISLEWLKSTFLPGAADQLEEHVEDTCHANALQSTQGEELLLKRGDVLKLESGATASIFAGEGEITADGAVVDVTEGVEVAAEGVSMAPLHRYLAAEETTANCTVTTDTTVVRAAGIYELIFSEEIDYNALALALRELGLFRGTDSPYGAGFELEQSPTRIQGLIMFLRLLGEEEAALAFTDVPVAFYDVPDWALPYVAYAYDKGYTKGQGIYMDKVVFGTEGILAARDYTTFLLRALGYVEETDFHWFTALEDAEALELLTEGERAMAEEKPFHRAQVVYQSYFTLSARLAGREEGILLDRLVNKGVFSREKADTVTTSVTVKRL